MVYGGEKSFTLDATSGRRSGGIVQYAAKDGL